MASIITQVEKRSGEIVDFDLHRITGAVKKAMDAAGEGTDSNAEIIAEATLSELMNSEKNVPHVEEIQDIVERQLIAHNFPKTAKAYILYREEHAKVRYKNAYASERVRYLANKSMEYFRNPLAEFIYYRTYSRWLETEGRRETWIESVQRFMEFMKENLGNKISEGEYREIHDAILKHEVMPSMRLMWSSGKAARQSNVCAYNCSYIAPTKIEDFGDIMYVLMCGTGAGFSVEGNTIQALPQIKKQTGKILQTHVIADSKEGWADSIKIGMKTWFNGEDIKFDYSCLRPRGARLRTMGGRSSGPEPLKAVLDFARELILKRQGKRLTTLDVHDIICKIGEIVVMGGVRRSALISLSDLDDSDMRESKSGRFYLTDPHRAMANNSAVYNEKPSQVEFLEEWIALMKSGSGERGIFNRGSLRKQLPERRWAYFEKDAATSGSNPCVTGDTWVMTSEGARQVNSLINVSFEAMINGNAYPSYGFFETGTKPVFEIRSNRGFSFRATGNHKVLVVDYRSRKVQRNVWKEVKGLQPHDKIVLHNQRGNTWKGEGDEKEGWLLGNLLGDGNIQKDGKANLDYWGETLPYMMERTVELIHSTVEARNDLTGHFAKTGYGRIGSKGVGNLALAYGMKYKNKIVTKEIEESSSDFTEGFMKGWFDADGSVQGNQIKGVSVRLSSSSLINLNAAQRMLARLGIISTVYQNRRPSGMRILPDGRGGRKSYLCNADHELAIAGDNIKIFADRVGFSDPLKKSKLENVIMKYKRKLNKESFISEVTEIIPIGEEKVYDCNVLDANSFDGNGVWLHNCGEIVLRSKQFCNLSEVIARKEDTKESLMKKVMLATILGTYQSSLTNFPYISKEWKKNCDEERLLGVSITGQWDCPIVRDPQMLKDMKEEAIKVNVEYAKKIGINPSTAITCVKPSGTVSQLTDAASGLHPRHSKYYIRRVRISATDSLFNMLKDQGIPYHPEVGQTMDNANLYVLEFPVKAPDDAIFRDDLTAIEQLEHWKMVKENYTEHNPSVTISIGENEWIDVAKWLYDNWDIIGGLSFLPREETVYQLAPYEKTDEATYNKLAEKFKDMDFSKIIYYEKDDDTQGAKELACISGSCDII